MNSRIASKADARIFVTVLVFVSACVIANAPCAFARWGGGGGGATRNVISCCLGSASVKIRGIRTMTPIRPISRMIAKVVVRPRFVFSLPPDSRRLSSNIVVSPCFRAYVYLDTDGLPFAPKIDYPRTLAKSALPAVKARTNKGVSQNRPQRHRDNYLARTGTAV